MATQHLFIYDYKFDQYLFLHAIHFKEEHGKQTRLGHKTIRLSHLPLRHHLGGFTSEEAAERVRQDLERGIASLKQADQEANGETVDCIACDFSYRLKVFHATPDISPGELRSKRRSLPFCFVQNPLGGEDWWVQLDLIYAGSKRFEYTQFFTSICKLEDEALQVYKATQGGSERSSAKVFYTDRNYDEASIRFLAPFGIPGRFAYELESALSINEMTTMHRKTFKQDLRATQTIDERNALLPTLSLLKRADYPPLLDSSYTVLFRVGVLLKCDDLDGSMTIYEVNLDSANLSVKSNGTLTPAIYHKLLNDPVKYRNNLDLILVPQTQHNLTRARAVLAEARKKSKYPVARKNLILNLMQVLEPRGSNLHSFQTSYHLAPIIVLETSVVGGAENPRDDVVSLKKWFGEFDLAVYVYQLLAKSRLSGLSWSFHEAPGETAIVSRRMESILTRVFTRNGFKVLPDTSCYQKSGNVTTTPVTPNANVVEDISDSEARDKAKIESHEGSLDVQGTIRFTFPGGLNPAVNPQIVTTPYSIVNADLSSYYAAGGISTHALDFCNQELCSKVAWKAKELTEQAAATRKSPSGSYTIDATPIAQLWHDHVLAKVKQGKPTPTARDPDGRDTVSSPHPFVEFIEALLALRQDLSSVTQREMKGVTSFLVAYVKMIVSAAYGAISFKGHRYHWPIFGPLVTNGCRKIILRLDSMITARFPEAERIMMVTDSVALRFPPNKLTKFAREFLEALHLSLKEIYGCEYLNIKIEYIDALIMTKTNSYATLRKRGEGDLELKVHGYAPKHAETPLYSARALNQFLADFLTCFTDTVIVKHGVSVATTTETKELFVKCLNLCFSKQIETGLVSPTIPKALLATCKPDIVARHTFETVLTTGNAERGHFAYPIEELEAGKTAAAANKSLGLVKGVVVDYSATTGFVVSCDPTRPVTKAAFERYYIHRQFRLPILDMFQTIFSIGDVDEAIRAILPCLQPVALDMASRRVLGHREMVVSTRRTGSEAALAQRDFWDRVYAYSRVRAPELKASSSNPGLQGEGEEERQLRLDTEAEEEASFWGLATDQVRKLEEKQFRDHRFEWHFEIECCNCGHCNSLPTWTNQILDEEEIGQSIALASTCENCKRTVYGDLMQLDSAEPPVANRVILCCREEASGSSVDFLEAGAAQGEPDRYRQTFAYRLKNYNSLLKFLAQLMGNSLLEQQKVAAAAAGGYAERLPLTCRKRPYNYPGLLSDTNNIRETPIATLLGIVMNSLERHPFFNCPSSND